MRITLDQDEITAAIELSISEKGINLSDKDVHIEYTGKRKNSGVRALVLIMPKVEDTSTKAPAVESKQTEPLTEDAETEADTDNGIIF